MDKINSMIRSDALKVNLRDKANAIFLGANSKFLGVNHELFASFPHAQLLAARNLPILHACQIAAA